MSQADCENSLILHAAPSSCNTSWDRAAAAASDCLHVSTARRRLGKGRGVQGQNKGEI